MKIDDILCKNETRSFYDDIGLGAGSSAEIVQFLKLLLCEAMNLELKQKVVAKTKYNYR